MVIVYGLAQIKCQHQRFQVFFGAEPPNAHSQPLVALALHADGTLAYGLPGLEPGGGDDNEESMEDDSALESDDDGDGTGVSLPHDEDGDEDDDDDDVVIVYERLVQG